MKSPIALPDWAIISRSRNRPVVATLVAVLAERLTRKRLLPFRDRLKMARGNREVNSIGDGVMARRLTSPYPSAKMPLRNLAEIAQLVEQCTENAWVLSSSLSLGTCSASAGPGFAGLVQLVEHLLAKEKVEGSSPLARSDRRPTIANRLSHALLGLR